MDPPKLPDSPSSTRIEDLDYMAGVEEGTMSMGLQTNLDMGANGEYRPQSTINEYLTYLPLQPLELPTINKHLNLGSSRRNN